MENNNKINLNEIENLANIYGNNLYLLDKMNNNNNKFITYGIQKPEIAEVDFRYDNFNFLEAQLSLNYDLNITPKSLEQLSRKINSDINQFEFNGFQYNGFDIPEKYVCDFKPKRINNYDELINTIKLVNQFK